MTLVKDIMTCDVLTVTPETEIKKIAELLLDKHINGVPVVSHIGAVVGIICQSDLIIQQKQLPIPSFFTFLDAVFPVIVTKQMEESLKKIMACTANQIMATDLIIVKPDTDLETVATLMVDKKIHTIPVVDNGKLVGIVGKEDIIATLV